MKIRKIKDKDGNNYIIEVNENSFEINLQKNTLNNYNYTCWSVEYGVKNEKSEKIGFGTFRIRCSSIHKHLEDSEVFDLLIIQGAFQIKKSIDKKKSIESGRYTILVRTCHDLIMHKSIQ